VYFCRILVFAPVAVSTVKVQVDSVYLGEADQSNGPLYVLQWEPFQYIGGLHTMVVQAVVSLVLLILLLNAIHLHSEGIECDVSFSTSRKFWT